MGKKMENLNYQELVDGYYDNLNNNLRNFKGGPGFLETWVHDEDHNRSLLEIFDLAHSHGIETLNIQLPVHVTKALNLDWLRRNASEYGALDVKGETLTFTTSQTANYQPDEYGALSEAYVDSLRQQTVRCEGRIESKGDAFTTSQGNGQLDVAVDQKGVVIEARHQGYKGPQRSLMDAFCSVLVGRPLQEGAEHGVIRLEAQLRDQTKPSKVKGLMTPEIADPIFALPTKLVRALWADYLNSKHIIQPKRNFWQDPIPQTWLDLAYEDKMKQAQIALTEGCRALGLQPDVLVTEIKHENRFTLSYKQNPEKPDFGRNMIKLERWLRDRLQFQVDLQLESIEDRNRREERTKRT